MEVLEKGDSPVDSAVPDEEIRKESRVPHLIRSLESTLLWRNLPRPKLCEVGS